MPAYIDADTEGFYDVATGQPVELTFDEMGNAYNAFTGEQVNLIGQGIQAAQNTLIGIFGRQGYPPDYGRDGRGFPRGARFPQGPQYGFSPGGVTPQGFQINWWAAGLIGVIVGAFVLGKRR